MEDPRHRVRISGTVTGAKEQQTPTPREGATVRMFVEGLLVATTATGSGGHFAASFLALADGRRQVAVGAWAPGFGIDEDLVWLVHPMDVHLRFQLTPGAGSCEVASSMLTASLWNSAKWLGS